MFQQHVFWATDRVGYDGVISGRISLRHDPRSLQSSLLGFAIFKVILRDQTFGPIENVLLQTAAVATATMPLAGGFVGIVPGKQFFTPLWSKNEKGRRGVRSRTSNKNGIEGIMKF
jgi:hypothetical protein